VLLTAALAAAVAGSIVYCLLTLIAAQSYRTARPARFDQRPPISVLKPLSGAEDLLEQNLRTFFTQDYPDYEILFAVRSADDPAVAVVEKLCAEYPARFVRLTVTGEPPFPNAKVYSLDLMRAAAQHDLLVMSDSDIEAAPGMLATLAAEFADPRVGMVTCPYRAVPGHGFWSRVEAIGMNTQFLGVVLVARLLEGMKFALGPTIAARKCLLNQIEFERLKDYLAEDFVMGKWAAEQGSRVLLSSCIIEHHIGGQHTGFSETIGHRLRWARSTRRSRPSGYVGQIFTMPVPLALLLWLWSPHLWPLAALALLARAASAAACAGWVLRDSLTARLWWLLPLEDLLAFAIWLAAFFGNQIIWRGRAYRLHPDGRFEAK
jgi:ceramide glucosyltransferase